MVEPVAAKVPVKELPPEIWKKILSNLEEPELMTCRSVNRFLKDLANEVLREKTSLWKPTFGTVQELVSGKRGIRFSTPDQITGFMEEMGGKPNPLPNGTVIFILDRELPGQQAEFQAEVCKFLDVFKDDIFHLVYVFNLGAIKQEMDLFKQFRSILKLKNLRSLVIDKYGSWEELLWYKSIRSQMFEMLASKEEVLPVKLKDLQIYGLSGSILLSYMFGGMESILKSVSSLDVSNNSHLDDSSPLYLFPNLTKLKVRSPNAQFLKQLQQFKPNSMASLKEVSLYFELEFYKGRGSVIDLALEETFGLLDIHAETLEFLHLDFGGWNRSADAAEINTSVKYKNLKRFSIQFNNRRYHCWLADVDEMVKKFVNLQEFFVLGDLPSLMRNRQSTQREQYEKIVEFWKVLPITVEVIHVLVYGWKINRGESLQFDEDGKVI